MSPTVKSIPTHSVPVLVRSPDVNRMFGIFEVDSARITDEHIRICSIPASPFREQERSFYFRDKLFALGLQASIDEEGNCIALRPGNSLAPLIVISAHLDTVFPDGTDFIVRSIDGKLFGPGVADDGCGLAAVLALVEACQSCSLRTEGSILFVATVGEEGEGNLRGVRHLFTSGTWANKIDAFVSFDGPGLERITNRGLGSRRYRVQLR
ncbi:MAG: M20/M25/M40 family metallo-hydrolase, partial [Pyrinomonadaceae bacterium]